MSHLEKYDSIPQHSTCSSVGIFHRHSLIFSFMLLMCCCILSGCDNTHTLALEDTLTTRLQFGNNSRLNNNTHTLALVTIYKTTVRFGYKLAVLRI
jgi:hypothetical protein